MNDETSLLPVLVLFAFIALGILAWAHERNRKMVYMDNCARMGRSVKRCEREFAPNLDGLEK